MKYTITFSRIFKEDLKVIYQDVVDTSKDPQIATKYIKELIEAIYKKLFFPHSNSKVNLYLEDEIRVINYKRYQIFYIIKDSEIIVLRALHISCDVLNILKND